MTTAPPAPPAPPARRPWTRLEAPQAVLVGVALVAIDLVVAIVVLVVRGDPSCTTLNCKVNGVSTTRPLAALLVAVVATIVPILVAWWRRSGLRTAGAVQLVVGGLLVAWAAASLGTAVGVHSHPPPVPSVPSERPCAAITLAGHTCLTYSQTAPPPPPT